MSPDVVIVALSGGGSLVALYRAWQGRKNGAHDATMSGFEAVITTLREEVDRYRTDRFADSARIERIEAQIVVERDMKWLGIQHIRALCSWIMQHMPGPRT